MRGDFIAALGRQDDLSLVNLLKQEWYNMVGGDFSTTPKFRFLDFALPFSGSTLQVPQEQLTPINDILIGDQFSFWNVNNTFVPNGLKAVRITDSG